MADELGSDQTPWSGDTANATRKSAQNIHVRVGGQNMKAGIVLKSVQSLPPAARNLAWRPIKLLQIRKTWTFRVSVVLRLNNHTHDCVHLRKTPYSPSCYLHVVNMLPKLPEELLSHIFSYLALPSGAELADTAESRDGPDVNINVSQDNVRSDQQALFNVCLASKTFYRLAWPTLYSAYSSCLADEDSLSPSHYLRTLCLKPEYGEALRSFSIRHRDTIEEINIERLYNYMLTGDAMTMAVFQWRARSFWLEGREGGKTFQDRLIRSLLIGMDDGIMCMILLMCPKITELTISLPWDCEESYLIKELFAVITSPETVPLPSEMPIREPPSSRYVTSQFLGNSWPDTRWQQPGVLGFLSELTLRSGFTTAWEPLLRYVVLLPSLKTLRIYNMIGGPSQDQRAAFETNATGRRRPHQLQTLHLPECRLDYWDFGELVQFFPNLKTLSIDWSVMNSFVSTAEFGRAVARYLPQLVNLTLDASVCVADEDSFDENRRMCNTIDDSIKTMQHLRRFKVNDQAIWDALFIQDGGDLENELFKMELGIRDALPTQLEWLEVISPRGGPQLRWKDRKMYVDYRRWQESDLCALLLDEAFAELKRVDIVNCKREVYTSDVRERGWVHEVMATERGAQVERLSRTTSR